LIRVGYPVTVFEAENEPGGMLRYAIPPYRLPDRILKREIDWIKNLGVEIKTGYKVKDPSKLLKKGFSAVLIAGGAPKSFPLGIEDEDAQGVIDALFFLKQINQGKTKKIQGEVVIIGGGSTAFDAARSSLRIGAKKVTLAYRRGFKEMPAEEEEIEAAKEEGIEILNLAIPNRILVKNKKVSGIEFLKAKLGKPDKSGRRRPVPIKNSEFAVKADVIIPAVGAMPDVGNVSGVKVTTPKGVIQVKENGQTLVDGVFAAGDVEMGPSSVVEAIGRGHVAAKGIDEYLGKKSYEETEKLVKSIQIYLGSRICSRTHYSPKREITKDKISNFKEVEQSLTDFEAVEEASRCFNCGPCYACPVCLPNCKNKQLVAEIENSKFLVKSPLELSEKINEKGTTSFKLKTEVKTQSIKLHSLTSKVDHTLCIGCGRCEEVCAYRAIKNIITKDERNVSQVAHASCASCSACVSECPSGAITQGFMSDNEILMRLKEKQTPFDGVKGLMSYWSTRSPLFDAYDGIIELMSARKPSPSFLIRALVRTGRGLLVIKPDEASGSHYLPWEESPDEVIEKTWMLLEHVGISPDRIQYVDLPKGENPTNLLKQFSKDLDKRKLGKLDISLPTEIQSPIGEAIALLRILSSKPDQKSTDVILSKSAENNNDAIFEGCLPMLHLIGDAHKIYDLSQTRHSIRKLLEITKTDIGFINDLKCPSKGLLSTKIKGIDKTIGIIEEDNKKVLNKLKPKKLILATPESYSSFLKEKYANNVSSLTEEFLKFFSKNSKLLKPLNKTIAIHHACSMKKDPFYESIKKLLELIPEIKIIELKDKCGQKGFNHLDGKSKVTAVNLMKKAVSKNADLILCTSPYCESHLMLCSREGSWRTVDIEISDIYKVLLSSITGDTQ
jgi:thioredoxin reductase/ferredoxin